MRNIPYLFEKPQFSFLYLYIEGGLYLYNLTQKPACIHMSERERRLLFEDGF